MDDPSIWSQSRKMASLNYEPLLECSEAMIKDIAGLPTTVFRTHCCKVILMVGVTIGIQLIL